jgi:hypothetical protein
LSKIQRNLFRSDADQLLHHDALYVQLARHSLQDVPQVPNLPNEVRMVLACEMFRHTVTLLSLMLIDTRIFFARNIDCTRVHYCIVPEKDFDQ